MQCRDIGGKLKYRHQDIDIEGIIENSRTSQLEKPPNSRHPADFLAMVCVN